MRMFICRIILFGKYRKIISFISSRETSSCKPHSNVRRQSFSSDYTRTASCLCMCRSELIVKCFGGSISVGLITKSPGALLSLTVAVIYNRNSCRLYEHDPPLNGL